jgi:hypothetical protein
MTANTLPLCYDKLDREVRVGDYVAYPITASILGVGKVIKISKIQLHIEVAWCDVRKRHDQVIKIGDADIIMYKLKQ